MDKNDCIQKKYSSIRSSVLFYMAFRNFTNKKLRSSLTVMAVVIGVGAIFFLLSLGLGVQELVTNQVIGDNSLKVVDVSSPNSKMLSLDSESVMAFSEYSDVEKVGVQYSFPGIVELSGGEIDIVVYGQDKNYRDLSLSEIIEGQVPEDDNSSSIVINSIALKELGISDAKASIGQAVKITIPLINYGVDKTVDRYFTIAAVTDSGNGGEVFMSSEFFDVLEVPNYSNVKIVALDTTDVERIRLHVESSGFQTTSLTDTMNEINDIFKLFTIILVGFGSIGMVVAILGMFNTITISLLERTKEISLMVALGARRSDIKRLFTYEAMIISFVGAIVGIILAFAAGKAVNLVLNLRAASRGVTEKFDLFATPLWVISLVILVTVLIGMLVVYFPARRAQRINPIDALRRE